MGVGKLCPQMLDPQTPELQQCYLSNFMGRTRHKFHNVTGPCFNIGHHEQRAAFDRGLKNRVFLKNPNPAGFWVLTGFIELWVFWVFPH